MAKYEVTYLASTGGKHVETFDAENAAEARKKAARYKRSFGSSGSSFRTAHIKKVSE